MAKEILAVPEQYVEEVILIIRTGLSNLDYSFLSDEVVEQLEKWCDEEEEYLNRGKDES